MAAARHDFVIVIPVADRPRHLADCLASLAGLLQHHPYGGEVSVLVADDSRESASRAAHQAIAAEHGGRGIKLHYLGQDAQRALVAGLPAGLRTRLAGVVGDGAGKGHQGASITRNLACLWLARLPAGGRPRLYWFVDSDQEFRVNVETAMGEELAYAVDYLGGLDRIFSETETVMVTGKVVGDPPVSPAVMAGNFLADVEACLAELAGLDPAAACAFHGAALSADEAAYHDMADLFGFRPAQAAWRYRCPLPGLHDNAATLAGFAARLGCFFDGEHPTRRSYYQAGEVMASLRPARTVYTGNYCFSQAGLTWFVPFAGLRLRMAGPTLGRIVRAELGDAFVSANLPMLHRRTVDGLGAAECRPGVERTQGQVDLAGEFERQYFGDVMLFTIERLTAAGFPGRAPEAAVATAVAATDADMLARYRARQAATAVAIDRLEALFEAPGQWWHDAAGLAGAHVEVRRFIANLRANFAADAPAWRRVAADDQRAARRAAIAAAIAAYPADRTAWHAALAGGAA
ncbi:MAG: hypothetical protein PHS77_06140 [Gallionellaceae bacterium]|nr:hypothetical protein [Gallionellaceae bacterium]